MVISKHVIPMGVLQKKLQILSTNSFKKPHQMISCKVLLWFRFKFVAKTILFDKGFWYFLQLSLTVSWYCWLIFCLLVIQDLENWCFLAFFMVYSKEVYVVSLSKISLSKSVKIFEWIFGITHSESHALSWVHNFAPVCKNTIFWLPLCRISAQWMHYFYQFWSFCQFVKLCERC